MDILPKLKSKLLSLSVRLVINWSSLLASLLSTSFGDLSGVLQLNMGENCLGGEEGLSLEEGMICLQRGLRDCLWLFQAERRLDLLSSFWSLPFTLLRIFLYISILDWVESLATGDESKPDCAREDWWVREELWVFSLER